MGALRKKLFIMGLFFMLIFSIGFGDETNGQDSYDDEKEDNDGDCEAIKNGSFNLEDCSYQEIAIHCEINNCTSPELFEELDEIDRGKIVGDILNYNNIPANELITPSNREYINITTPEFVNFYNSAKFSFQEVVYTNLVDYKGKLDSNFFAAINKEENLKRFRENYNFGDISDFFKDLNWSERREAFKGWMDPDDSQGLGNLDSEMLLEILNDKGYNLDELSYPKNFNISLYDGYLMTNTSSIELESLHNITSLYMYENNTITMDGIKLINATRVNLEEGISTRQADFIKTPEYKVYNSYGFNKTNESIAFTDADKFLFGNSTTKNYTNTFENISDAVFGIHNDSIISGFFKAKEDGSNYNFEGGMLNISIDSDDWVNFTKTKERYNISIDSENATVTDKNFYTRYIEIPPGCRYSYEGSEFEPFSVFIPSYGELFKLYLRIHEDENFVFPEESFGFFNFINTSANIEGIFQYEKKPDEMPGFRNAINAVDKSSCNLTFDNQMKKANLTYESDEIEINSQRIEISFDDVYRYSFTDFSYADLFEKIDNSMGFFGRNFKRETMSTIILYQKDSVEAEKRLEELEEWFEWLK